MDEQTLTRQRISEAVNDTGWRFMLGVIRTCVRVPSMDRASDVAARVVAASGADADEHLTMDLRRGRVVVSLQTASRAWVTPRDIELAHEISANVRELGLATTPETGGGEPRSVQILEIAIDALDIGSVRPFWKAVLGYADEPGGSGPQDPLVDPVGQAPAIWFQQMDAPRPQRNRIHFDICVPHDEAAHRIEAALAAGGRLLSDKAAPAFWVLADAEGNEACVTTWQGRD